MSRENVEIVRRVYAAFAHRDNESPFAVYHPDIEWVMPRSGAPLPGEERIYHGHEGVRRYWRAWLEAREFPFERSVDELVDAGEQVVALLGKTTVRGKASGVEVDLPPWAQVWTPAMEKWFGCGSIPDHAQALEAAGLEE